MGEGEDYKGGRTLADLKKFATNELGPGCSVDTMENCTDEQKAALQTYIDMPAEERASTLETLKTELKDAESKHETLLKELQATYKASMDGLEKLKEESAPKIKLLLCPMIAGVEPLRGQAHVAACACRSRCASDMTPGLINSLIGGEDRGDASMPLS